MSEVSRLGPHEVAYALLREWYVRGSITDDERGELWSLIVAMRSRK